MHTFKEVTDPDNHSIQPKAPRSRIFGRKVPLTPNRMNKNSLLSLTDEELFILYVFNHKIYTQRYFCFKINTENKYSSSVQRIAMSLSVSPLTFGACLCAGYGFVLQTQTPCTVMAARPRPLLLSWCTFWKRCRDIYELSASQFKNEPFHMLYLGLVIAAAGGGSCVPAGLCGLGGAAGSPECSQPGAWRLCGSAGVCERALTAAGRPPPTACCSSEMLRTRGRVIFKNF